MIDTGLVVLGAVAALPYVLLARLSRQPERYFSVGLLVAALLYLVFAAAAGAGRDALLVESLGVLGFGALAVAGFLGSPLWTSLGWALHVGWDVALHPLAGGGYAPWWYPLACIGFDLLVAGAIWRFYRVRTR